jgi:hypothetical protein
MVQKCCREEMQHKGEASIAAIPAKEGVSHILSLDTLSKLPRQAG